MIDGKIHTAIAASLQAFSEYGNFNAVPYTEKFISIFSTDKDFLGKVEDMDAQFDDVPELESLREVFFDMLMINFFSADAVRLEEDYLESAEWEAIEEDTIDRGTELLNLLLYLTECMDEHIEPELDDYLKEFLLVDDDEFQDEYKIYEPIIENQLLIDSQVDEIARVAQKMAGNAELKELFYPLMCYFQNPDPKADDVKEIAKHAPVKDFDMAVFDLLVNFK